MDEGLIQKKKSRFEFRENSACWKYCCMSFWELTGSLFLEEKVEGKK